MPAGSIKIEGLRELEVKLKGLGPKLEKKAFFSAAFTGAEVIREKAEQNVSWTSRLKNNIVKKRGKAKRGEVVVNVGPNRDGFYGVMLEFGTKPRTQKTTGKFTGQVSARPWLRPAFDSAREKAVRVFGQKLGKKITLLAKSK